MSDTKAYCEENVCLRYRNSMIRTIPRLFA